MNNIKNLMIALNDAQRPNQVSSSRIVIALDPGPIKTAIIAFIADEIIAVDYALNADVLDMLAILTRQTNCELWIEMIASYGMAVGAEVFETCVWIGRFMQRWGRSCKRVKRMEVKMHLCQNSRAKDDNIRKAVIDRLGNVGTKKNPGPTFGVTGDMWAAVAVACLAWDSC